MEAGAVVIADTPYEVPDAGLQPDRERLLLPAVEGRGAGHVDGARGVPDGREGVAADFAGGVGREALPRDETLAPPESSELGDHDLGQGILEPPGGVLKHRRSTAVRPSPEAGHSRERVAVDQIPVHPFSTVACFAGRA